MAYLLEAEPEAALRFYLNQITSKTRKSQRLMKARKEKMERSLLYLTINRNSNLNNSKI